MAKIHEWPCNRQFFDRYSVVHGATGILFQAAGVPPLLAIGGHVAFELVENTLKEAIEPVWPDIRPDCWQNHLGDSASFVSGYFASSELRKTDAGQAALTAFVALGAGIWTWNLLRRHSWKRP